MTPIRSHRDLHVWRKGMDLVQVVYRLTNGFPPDERFRLVGQMTRAAVSVPANLAEGHSRATRRDYANFVAIARSSLMELDTYVLIAVRLGYLTNEASRGPLAQIDELSRMLSSLRKRLVEPTPRPSPWS